jgi:DNA-binding NarL/FixJ family response regulator
MKSTKAYSAGIKELRLKLGIKPPPSQTESDERATQFKRRVKAVVRELRKRSEIATHRTRGPQYRWTAEEDQKLMRSRASGLEWTSIAKELHRSPHAVKNRFLRLLARRSWP